MSDNNENTEGYHYGREETRGRRRWGLGGLVDAGMEAASKGIDVGAKAVGELGSGWRQHSAQKHELELEKLRLQHANSSAAELAEAERRLREQHAREDAEQAGKEEQGKPDLPGDEATVVRETTTYVHYMIPDEPGAEG